MGTLKELPSTVEDPGLTVYQNLQITHLNIESSNVKSASIEFSVALTWLTENSLEVNDVGLYRYNEVTKTWTALTTTYLRSASGNAQYSAKSPGLSYFVVAATPPAPVEVEPAPIDAVTGAVAEDITGAVTEEEAMEEGEEGGIPNLFIYIGLTLLVVIAATIYETKKHKKAKLPGMPPPGL